MGWPLEKSRKAQFNFFPIVSSPYSWKGHNISEVPLSTSSDFLLYVNISVFYGSLPPTAVKQMCTHRALQPPNQTAKKALPSSSAPCSSFHDVTHAGHACKLPLLRSHSSLSVNPSGSRGSSVHRPHPTLLLRRRVRSHAPTPRRVGNKIKAWRTTVRHTGSASSSVNRQVIRPDGPQRMC